MVLITFCFSKFSFLLGPRVVKENGIVFSVKIRVLGNFKALQDWSLLSGSTGTKLTLLWKPTRPASLLCIPLNLDLISA